jgi:preprotein translocase subunit YajC
MFSSIAWAQAAAPAAPSLMETIFPFAIMFLVIFFLFIRPQQRRNSDQNKFREALKKGDSVLTSGGILGTIEGLTERFVTLQISNGVKIKVLRTAIAAGVTEELEKK